MRNDKSFKFPLLIYFKLQHIITKIFIFHLKRQCLQKIYGDVFFIFLECKNL